MVSAVVSVLVSGREPYLFACNVQASVIIIIGPVSLKVFYNQSCYS